MSLCSPRALAEDPQAWLDAAIRRDLDGKGSAQVAFAGYLRAAEAGLPEAEFDVAVMLDSGRGVRRDVASAATWYARAAAHADRRAAYNLGQLYEDGDGVPKNSDLARAWFTASDVAAARLHLETSMAGPPAEDWTVPEPAAPSDGARIGAEAHAVELVWTSRAQPEAAEFFVELWQIDQAGSRELFSGFTRLSSILVSVPSQKGDYAWRVSILGRRAGLYMTGDWHKFGVGSDDQTEPVSSTLSAR